MNRLAALHAPGRLLVLPNAWDALSARLIEEAGAEAIATAGAAVAWTHGRPDTQSVPLDELVRAVSRVAGAVKVPVTVDLDRGYANDAEGVADAVARVVDAGAEGVNLEDGGGPPDELAAKIAAVRWRLGSKVFVNARTCIVLRGLVASDRAAGEVLARARIYADAGADGLFVPLLADPDVIRTIAHGTPLPLNVMIVPGLPSPARLRELGVRRVSAGPRVAEVAYAAARSAARELLWRGAYETLVSPDLTYPAANALFT